MGKYEFAEKVASLAMQIFANSEFDGEMTQGVAIRVAMRVIRTAATINNIDSHFLNYGENERMLKRRTNALARIREWLAPFTFAVEHQSDPRGLPLEIRFRNEADNCGQRGIWKV